MPYLNIIYKIYRRYRWPRILLHFFGALLIAFISLNIIFPLKINIEYSTIVTDKDNKVLYAFLSKDGKWRMKTELNEISPMLRKTIVYKEDKYFFYHPGVNAFAMGRALLNNILHLRKTSGASTITMQVARMLEPKDRNIFNKIIEMFRAFQLELHYSKSQILQLYLNMVPYGSNVEGVKSASIIYFQKEPLHLSLAEITALSVIPNRPITLRIGKNNKDIIKERNHWLLRFKRDNLYSSKIIADAYNEPLDATRHDVPHLAPQFSIRMQSKFYGFNVIHSSLNIGLQEKIETIARAYLERLQLRNINNASVIVVKNKTRQVVAYLGSANFEDRIHHGEVDGITAYRSPGSTLKPFLYGIAFDKGLLTPKMPIADIPININGYHPENYDRKYRGNVTVEQALYNSLNIPAVKTLDEVGLDVFTKSLSKAGFSWFNKDQNKVGLAVILGGCGVKLEELVNLYASFPNKGNYAQLHWLFGDTANLNTNILSPESAYMISDILTKLNRPDLPNGIELNYHLPKIAWKTGTSYGRRDAWSIGYNNDYTIGVWVGNFEGRGVAELTGSEVASPLLFDIFNAIDYNSNNDWLNIPKGLGFRLVCNESGLPPSDFCNDQVMDYHIPLISPNTACTHLKEVFLSADGKFSYCTQCLPTNGYIKKYFPNYPPDLLAFYENQHVPHMSIPPHNPDCKRILIENAPVITSISDGNTYYIENKLKQKLGLGCSVDNEVHKVFWYINNKAVGSLKPSEKLFLLPPPGRIKISCTDDRGRNTDIQITIVYLD